MTVVPRVHTRVNPTGARPLGRSRESLATRCGVHREHNRSPVLVLATRPYRKPRLSEFVSKSPPFVLTTQTSCAPHQQRPENFARAHISTKASNPSAPRSSKSPSRKRQLRLANPAKPASATSARCERGPDRLGPARLLCALTQEVSRKKKRRQGQSPHRRVIPSAARRTYQRAVVDSLMIRPLLMVDAYSKIPL